MRFHRVLAVLPLATLLLAGCTPAPTPDPDATDPRPPAVEEEADCVVGTWTLDVPAYAAESEAYVVGLGIPITGFAMTGGGEMTFTDDGLVAVDIALQTTGTIVAGDANVPIDVPSTYTATGDWSRTDLEMLRFDNWANVVIDDGIPPEVDLPGLDVTQLADVEAQCTSDSLYIAGPGVPIGALWTR